VSGKVIKLTFPSAFAASTISVDGQSVEVATADVSSATVVSVDELEDPHAPIKRPATARPKAIFIFLVTLCCFVMALSKHSERFMKLNTQRALNEQRVNILLIVLIKLSRKIFKLE